MATVSGCETGICKKPTDASNLLEEPECSMQSASKNQIEEMLDWLENQGTTGQVRIEVIETRWSLPDTGKSIRC